MSCSCNEVDVADLVTVLCSILYVYVTAGLSFGPQRAESINNLFRRSHLSFATPTSSIGHDEVDCTQRPGPPMCVSKEESGK